MCGIMVCDHFLHCRNYCQCSPFTYRIILLSQDQLSAGIQHRVFTPLMHLEETSPKLRSEASVCKVNSWFKSGNFKIGSIESRRFISKNVFSCLSPHSTLFEARFFVSSVIGTIISAQFGISPNKSLSTTADYDIPF